MGNTTHYLGDINSWFGHSVKLNKLFLFTVVKCASADDLQHNFTFQILAPV